MATLHHNTKPLWLLVALFLLVSLLVTEAEAWGRKTPEVTTTTAAPKTPKKPKLHPNYGIVPKEPTNTPKSTAPATAAGGTSKLVFYPVHPRVNINWTENAIKANLTRTERRNIERSNLVLTKLIVVNRHGHRAPNEAYWKMCPNDIKSLRRYNVDYEDLSALGMQEEYNFGAYMRNKYRDFLGDRFNRSLHYFRAVGETRILQSAMAVAQGMFPDGFGPGGYLPTRPQFVPIFSDMDTHEYLLDDVPCFRRAEADSARWIAENFAAFAADPYVNSTVTKMKEICGPYNGTAPEYAYVKTVADGMIFNSEFGKKVCGGRLTPELLLRIRNVSVQLLFQRLYNTDEQQTYTVVDLPYNILRLLNHTHLAAGIPQINDFRDTRHESTFFFVHRESLYALAQFFGFQYRIAGLPQGEVPVASSLIIEKLMPEKDQYSHDDTKIYVRLSLWTPYDGTHTVPVPACRIPELCEVAELRAIYDTRNARTGDWMTLCNYKPQEMDHTTDIR